MNKQLATEEKRQCRVHAGFEADGVERSSEVKTQAVDVLWRRFKQQNDQAAREQLLTRYLPLVKYVSGRLALKLPTSVDSNDLVGWGVLGLIDALEKFNLSSGIKFETYASVRVKGAMLDGIRSLDWAPRSLRHSARQIMRVAEDLSSTLGRRPTEEELAEKIGIDMEKLEELLHEIDSSSILSLDTIISCEEESDGPTSRVELTEDGAAPSPREQAEKKEKVDLLARAIASLPQQERTVVHLYYFEELTLKEIAQLMNVTESRVCQIGGSAIRRLRQVLARAPL